MGHFTNPTTSKSTKWPGLLPSLLTLDVCPVRRLLPREVSTRARRPVPLPPRRRSLPPLRSLLVVPRTARRGPSLPKRLRSSTPPRTFELPRFPERPPERPSFDPLSLPVPFRSCWLVVSGERGSSS